MSALHYPLIGRPRWCANTEPGALTGNEVRPMNTQPSSAAAGEHFADAERILAGLPFVRRSAERDRHVQIALVHAVLAIAAGATHLGEGSGAV